MNGAKKIFYIEFSFDIRLALAIGASIQSLPKFCVSNILRQQVLLLLLHNDCCVAPLISKHLFAQFENPND